MMASERFFNVFLQAARGDGVGDDGSALVALQSDGACDGHEAVAVELVPFGINGAAAIHVSVEDDAQIGLRADGCAADGFHGRRVLRVRDMIREHAVGLEELAAGDIRAERSEHVGCIEAARAVSGVDDDMEAFERMLIVLGLHASLIFSRRISL